jgi:hypothetical protein
LLPYFFLIDKNASVKLKGGTFEEKFDIKNFFELAKIEALHKNQNNFFYIEDKNLVNLLNYYCFPITQYQNLILCIENNNQRP